MKKILLEKLLDNCKEQEYQKQYEYIINLLEEKKIKPVKASRLNGKSPALYREYWLLEETKDYSNFIEELRYQIIPDISVDYYLRHLESYEADREWVLQLNKYLKERKETLQFKVSANERSFEIWGREKFLSKGQGRRILKRCGLEMSFFNIYGAGKGIFRSFEDFDLCVEPYMKAAGNQIYYFGDLDYEGIGIYENLSANFGEKWNIVPFEAGYRKMLSKAKGVDSIPETKEGQNRNIKDIFFSYFSTEQVKRMKEILEKGYYIPQEILNISDF